MESQNSSPFTHFAFSRPRLGAHLAAPVVFLAAFGCGGGSGGPAPSGPDGGGITDPVTPSGIAVVAGPALPPFAVSSFRKTGDGSVPTYAYRGADGTISGGSPGGELSLAGTLGSDADLALAGPFLSFAIGDNALRTLGLSLAAPNVGYPSADRTEAAPLYFAGEVSEGRVLVESAGPGVVVDAASGAATAIPASWAPYDGQIEWASAGYAVANTSVTRATGHGRASVAASASIEASHVGHGRRRAVIVQNTTVYRLVGDGTDVALQDPKGDWARPRFVRYVQGGRILMGIQNERTDVYSIVVGDARTGACVTLRTLRNVDQGLIELGITKVGNLAVFNEIVTDSAGFITKARTLAYNLDGAPVLQSIGLPAGQIVFGLQDDAVRYGPALGQRYDDANAAANATGTLVQG